MPKTIRSQCRSTAVDDVRRVREKIASGHAGDLRQHLDETARIAASMRTKLRIKVVHPPATGGKRTRASG